MTVNLISIPVAMMAAMCFYTGFTYLWFSIKSNFDKESMVFSLLCFIIALYDLFSMALYNSTNLDEGMLWQRLQLLTIPLIAGAFSTYVFTLIKGRSRNFFFLLFSYFVLLFLIGLFTGNRLSLKPDSPMIRDFYVFGSIHAIYYEVELGLLGSIQNISMIAVFIYLLYILIKEYLSGTKILPVVISFSLFFLAILNDVLVGIKVYSFVYLAEYAFLLIIISMSQAFLTRFVDTSVKLTELNISLDKKVEERTRQLEDLMLELSESNKELTIQSTVDGLTGVKNRRYLNNQLQNEWKRSRREALVNQKDKLPLSLLLIDLDHFKKVNDRYGHLAGDECLKTIAAVLKGIVKRPADIIARYGGEEFALVLPATHAAGAANVAEKARSAVEKTDFEYQGQVFKVTISIGVVTLLPSDDIQSDTLLAAADKALYKAKENGRNQVCIYQGNT